MRFRWRLAVMVALVVVVAGAGAALGSGRVTVHEGFAYKPHELTISGDGDYIVQGLRWHSWGGKQAVARGGWRSSRSARATSTTPTPSASR